METTHEQIRQEVMRKIKFGQTICIRDSLQETDPPRVRVTAFYPDFVLCLDKHGSATCYKYHDLWLRLKPIQRQITVPEYIKE